MKNRLMVKAPYISVLMVTPVRLCWPLFVFDNKREKYALWTDGVFSNYLKHRLNLAITRVIQDMNRKPSTDESVNCVPIRDQGNANILRPKRR